MEDIYALLNINKNLIQDFPLKANNIIDHQTELFINRAVHTLKEIEERMMTDELIKVSPQLIDETIQKVIDNSRIQNQDMSIWGYRELRIVSYYQIKLQGNNDAYKYSLRILDNNWRNLFFNGLSFYCLDNWNLIDPELRALTCELLRKKLALYQETNKKYLVMKNHANLFDEAGPLRMSTLITQKKQNLNEAPSYFGNRPSTLSRSYYSDVIVNYCNSNFINDLEYIESIFEHHNLDRTKKLVIADLVDRFNQYGDEINRTNLCKFAYRMLGDITIKATWAPFDGATENDAQKLKRAQQLVTLWFNQKIIETFFEVCVQDRLRKEFWLECLTKFNSFNFRIIGSNATKRLLQSDSRISGMFLNFFIETESSTASTAALVFFIKNKMLVEFSDTGALYVYNKEHMMTKKVKERKQPITTTNDLKIPSMTNLISINDRGYNYYYDEGRMIHNGDWQKRLKGWMNQKLLSSNNNDISFIDSEADDIFHANPIKKEAFQPGSYTREPNKNNFVKNIERQSLSIKSQQTTSTVTSKSSPIVYEKRVFGKVLSIWILNDKYQVIANEKGFYINIKCNNKSVFISGSVGHATTSGNIRIRQPNKTGWLEVLHGFCGKENTVGYIKETEDGILFKQDLNQVGFLNIKVH